MSLSNKVIVVCGGGGLLGRRFCTAIAKHRGLVIVADVNMSAATNIAEEIESNGGMAEPGLLDIADAASLDRLIQGLHARHGRIDAVVNSAYPRNKNWGRRLEDVAYADFCENLGLHLGGYFLVAQKFALYFREHGGGSIVNMASIYGSMAPKLGIYAGTQMTMPVEYAAIKSAVIHLTRYFAQYFKGDGVRCNSLSPGGILDRQPEQFLKEYGRHCAGKGMLNPEDVTGALVFLLSDASRYMTGQDLIVDDGFSL